MCRYVATELCYTTLKQLIRHNDEQQLEITDSKELLCQIGLALQFLHDKSICHRNLKPSSILISRSNGTLRQHVKLTNFAFTRASSTCANSPLHKLVESKGWLPPEIYHPQATFTSVMDVFSLGLVITYVLSRGIHVFGNDKESRISNIKMMRIPMAITIQHLKDVVGAEEALSLIKMMLSFNP